MNTPSLCERETLEARERFDQYMDHLSQGLEQAGSDGISDSINCFTGANCTRTVACRPRRRGGQVVAVSELTDAIKQIRELQQMRGEKTMENAILRAAVECGRSKNGLGPLPRWQGRTSETSQRQCRV